MVATLLERLTPDLVTLEVQPMEAFEATRAVAAPLGQNPAVLDHAAFLTGVQAREEMCSTAIGHSLAFPHARGDFVSDIVIAAGRSQAGVNFGDPAAPVHLMFVIGTPLNRVREYLTLLATLARSLRGPRLQEQLKAVATPAEFVAALRAGL